MAPPKSKNKQTLGNKYNNVGHRGRSEVVRGQWNQENDNSEQLRFNDLIAGIAGAVKDYYGNRRKSGRKSRGRKDYGESGNYRKDYYGNYKKGYGYGNRSKSRKSRGKKGYGESGNYRKDYGYYGNYKNYSYGSRRKSRKSKGKKDYGESGSSGNYRKGYYGYGNYKKDYY